MMLCFSGTKSNDFSDLILPRAVDSPAVCLFSWISKQDFLRISVALCCMCYGTIQPHQAVDGYLRFTRQQLRLAVCHCFLNNTTPTTFCKIGAVCFPFQTPVCGDNKTCPSQYPLDWETIPFIKGNHQVIFFHLQI